MSIKTTAVTVTTDRIELSVGMSKFDKDGKQTVTYQNLGTVDVTLGDSAVTAGNGLRLAPGGTSSEVLGADDRRFAVVATGTAKVIVDQVGV